METEEGDESPPRVDKAIPVEGARGLTREEIEEERKKMMQIKKKKEKARAEWLEMYLRITGADPMKEDRSSIDRL